MESNAKQEWIVPYIHRRKRSTATQMDLFSTISQIENGEKMVKIYSRELEKLLEREQPDKEPGMHYASQLLSTFNIFPYSSSRRHLAKANIASKAEEAIYSDWQNVFMDLYTSYIREAKEVELKRA